MYLVLGSCRAIEAMFHSKFRCPTITQYNFKNIHYLGRGWSTLEHLELLRLIVGSKPLSEYRGFEVRDEDFKNSLKWVQKEWDNIQGVIMEVSSIKYFKEGHRLVHNLPMKKWNCFEKNILTDSQMMGHLEEITNILDGKESEKHGRFRKRVIFVNHFLHTKVPNRLRIDSCLQKIKSDRVLVITPSSLWNENTAKQYLRDPLHYRKGKRKLLSLYFENCIESHFGHSFSS